MSIMRSPKPCKPTVAFGYRVGAADSTPEKEGKGAVDKKGAVATKVLTKKEKEKENDEDGTDAVRRVLAIARKKAMERNIVTVGAEDVLEEEEEEEERYGREDYSTGSSSSHSNTLDSSLNTPSHNVSAAASSNFSVYADADAEADADGPTTPPTVDTPYNNDNSHYSLPPSAMPPAPPVPRTEQSFGNMLDTSPMQDSPSLQQTGGSRRSVLASIDDGVRRSQEFLRSYEEVWHENSAPTTPNDNTMDIGAAKLRELQRELDEVRIASTWGD